MNLFLYGIIFAAAVTAMCFFFDFWKRTRDPLFLYFALAFGLLGVERLVLAFLTSSSEYKVYLIRLAAFILFLVAILQKNRRNRG